MYNATYSAHYHFLGLIFVFWKTSPINSTWPKASHSETSAEWAASAHALSAVSFMWPILLCLTRRHLPWQTIGDSDVLTVLHCFWGGEFFLTLILLPKPVLDLTSSQYRVLFYHLYTALHERHNLGVGHVWVSNGQQYCESAWKQAFIVLWWVSGSSSNVNYIEHPQDLHHHLRTVIYSKTY